jgi:hypothetical protein
MKNTKTFVSTLVLIATLVFLPLSALYSVAQDQKAPTKKEFKTLLKTAKEPSEHLKIAVLQTRSCTLDRQFKRAFGISQDLHQEPSLRSNGGKARRHVRPRGEPLQ